MSLGEIVKVSFNVRGRSYIDKKDGSTKYISNIDAWRIESATAATGGGGNNSYSAPSATSNTASYGGNKAAPPAFGATPNFNPSQEIIDDLPF